MLKTFAVTATMRLATLACAAALNVLVARVLGPEGRGLYALPVIACGLAATFVLGLSSAVSHVMLREGASRGIVRAAASATAAFLVVGALATVVTASFVRAPGALGPALAMLPFSALSALALGYSIGRDRIRHWGAITLATQAAVLVAVALGFVVVGRSAAVAVGGWLAGSGIVALAAAALAYRDARRAAPGRVDARAFLVFGCKAGAVNVVTLLNYRIDVYIVAAVAPLATLGLYVVAVAGAEAAVSLAHAFSLVTQPRVGRLDAAASATFTARCARNNLLFATVVCVAVALVAEPVVPALFGPRFAVIVPVLRVLLVGVVALSAGTVIANYFVLNAGRTTVPLLTGALSTAICAALAVALVPRIGVMGAALGTTAGYVVSQTFAVVAFCRATGIAAPRVLLVDASDVATYRRILQRRSAAV